MFGDKTDLKLIIIYYSISDVFSIMVRHWFAIVSTNQISETVQSECISMLISNA